MSDRKPSLHQEVFRRLKEAFDYEVTHGLKIDPDSLYSETRKVADSFLGGTDRLEEQGDTTALSDLRPGEKAMVTLDGYAVEGVVSVGAER